MSEPSRKRPRDLFLEDAADICRENQELEQQVKKLQRSQVQLNQQLLLLRTVQATLKIQLMGKTSECDDLEKSRAIMKRTIDENAKDMKVLNEQIQKLEKENINTQEQLTAQIVATDQLRVEHEDAISTLYANAEMDATEGVQADMASLQKQIVEKSEQNDQLRVRNNASEALLKAMTSMSAVQVGKVLEMVGDGKLWDGNGDERPWGAILKAVIQED